LFFLSLLCVLFYTLLYTHYLFALFLAFFFSFQENANIENFLVKVAALRKNESTSKRRKEQKEKRERERIEELERVREERERKREEGVDVGKVFFSLFSSLSLPSVVFFLSSLSLFISLEIFSFLVSHRFFLLLLVLFVLVFFVIFLKYLQEETMMVIDENEKILVNSVEDFMNELD